MNCEAIAQARVVETRSVEEGDERKKVQKPLSQLPAAPPTKNISQDKEDRVCTHDGCKRIDQHSKTSLFRYCTYYIHSSADLPTTPTHAAIMSHHTHPIFSPLPLSYYLLTRGIFFGGGGGHCWKVGWLVRWWLVRFLNTLPSTPYMLAGSVIFIGSILASA